MANHLPANNAPSAQAQNSPTPHADPAEHAARDTFLALMWALSYPGTLYELPQTATQTNAVATGDSTRPLLAIGRALLDLETSYYTPDAHLAAQLAHTSARALPPAAADYHFYPAPAGFTAADFAADFSTDVCAAKVGDFLYPDQSATLIVACTLGRGTRLRLQGPGIDPRAAAPTLQVDGLPANFWELRDAALRYPLGWDLFLVDGQGVDGQGVDGQRVAGLPRTTTVTIDQS